MIRPAFSTGVKGCEGGLGVPCAPSGIAVGICDSAGACVGASTGVTNGDADIGRGVNREGATEGLPRGTRGGGRVRRGHDHRRRLAQGGRRANTTPPAGIPTTASHGSRPSRSFGSTPSQAPRSRQSPHRARHSTGWVQQGPAFSMRTAIKGQSPCSMRQRNQALTAAERASPGPASVRLSPKARAARRATTTSPRHPLQRLQTLRPPDPPPEHPSSSSLTPKDPGSAPPPSLIRLYGRSLQSHRSSHDRIGRPVTTQCA
jgi:hypothetical protein